LSIGIHRNELDSAYVLVDHPVEGIAAAPADADDFHARVLRNGFFEFEDHGSPLGLRRSPATIASVARTASRDGRRTTHSARNHPARICALHTARDRPAHR